MALEVDIVLVDNTRLELDDESIIANSVSIQMSTCREKSFDFGTFNAAVLSIGIIDDDALRHDFSGAIVQLAVTEIDSEGDEVQYDIGQYYIDPKTVVRQRNVVKFKAYDAATKFDVDLPSNVRSTSYTALTAIQAACTACGVNLWGALPTGSPNTSVTFTLANAAIQTWRDVVMWACQLICANAVINRSGMLEIRQAWYVYDAPGVLEVNANMRVDCQFSDSRTFLKYLNSYSGNKVKRYTSALSSPDHSLDGEMSLKKNPLLDGKSESDCDTINAALLSVPIVQRQIKAKMFEDAGIALGDIVKFKDGKIDVRRSVRGKITSITWKYHGYTTVVSSAPDVV